MTVLLGCVYLLFFLRLKFHIKMILNLKYSKIKYQNQFPVLFYTYSAFWLTMLSSEFFTELVIYVDVCFSFLLNAFFDPEFLGFVDSLLAVFPLDALGKHLFSLSFPFFLTFTACFSLNKFTSLNVLSIFISDPFLTPDFRAKSSTRSFFVVSDKLYLDVIYFKISFLN